MLLLMKSYSSRPFCAIILSLLLNFRQGFAFRSISPQRGFLGAQSSLFGRTRKSRTLISSSASEEDLSRWEDMYNEGRERESQSMQEDFMRSEVRVVTFDLDNTLWKTGACIQAANDALADHLSADSIVQPRRVEKVMGDLFKADKLRYSPLDDNATAPVLLTKLRTDAIRSVLEEHNGYESDDAIEYAEMAFDVWTNARHGAIPTNFAEAVIDTLDRISSLKTSRGTQVLIGAITDGNSDPRKVEILEKYFDFCVNAEMVGASKPDKRVYLEAAKQVFNHPSLQDVDVRDMDNEDDLENAIGPYWVHIGDDFMKDVVAAKGLKMRTIWCTELIRDKLKGNQEDRKVAKPTMDEKEFVKKMSEKTTIEMAVGDDFYLADTMRDEFVDAILEEFSHLGDTLVDWHTEGRTGVADSPTDGTNDKVDVETNDEIDIGSEQEVADTKSSESDDIVTVVLPDKPLENTIAAARAFRLVREDCTMDVPAPIQNRDKRTMQDVMTIAQMDKTSGVFAFPAADVEDLRTGKKSLMIKIGGTDLEVSKEFFASMTVQEVLSFTDEEPVKLTLYMKKASDAPSFDIF